MTRPVPPTADGCPPYRQTAKTSPPPSASLTCASVRNSAQLRQGAQPCHTGHGTSEPWTDRHPGRAADDSFGRTAEFRPASADTRSGSRQGRSGSRRVPARLRGRQARVRDTHAGARHNATRRTGVVRSSSAAIECAPAGHPAVRVGLGRADGIEPGMSLVTSYGCRW